MRAIASVTALMLSTGLLLLGHGMQLTLLPLRAHANGMSDSLIGFSASCYYLGFIIGCFAIPHILARVGHIRTFAVLIATMLCAILLLDLFSWWFAWLALRLLTGITICGLYTVIESWLNTQSSTESRGSILAFYTFVTLLAMTLGQLLINVGPIDSSIPFSLVAIFLALAIIPIGLTGKIAPLPVPATRIDFARLYQRSHSAFAGALLSGVIVGSFWSLGALFARSYSESALAVTWFMSTAIIGGALLQYPIGWLSDRIDRRQVIIWLASGGSVASLLVAFSVGHSWHLLAVFLFGACMMPIYAISLATAADVCNEGEFVEVSSAVLLLNAIGAFATPLLLGPLMGALGGTSLFWAFAVLSAVFCAYLLKQLRASRAVPITEQTPFSMAAPDVAPTSFGLDPRGPELVEPPSPDTGR